MSRKLGAFDPAATADTVVVTESAFSWNTSINSSYYTFADSLTVQKSGSSQWGYPAVSTGVFTEGKFSIDFRVNALDTGTKRTNFGIVQASLVSLGGSNWLSKPFNSNDAHSAGLQDEGYSTGDIFTLNVNFDDKSLELLQNNSIASGSSVGSDTFSTSGTFHIAYQELSNTSTFEVVDQVYTPPTGFTKITPTGGVLSTTTDTRSHSHVWNYPDIYKARRADTWPAMPAPTRTITIHVAGGGGGGGGQNAGGDGGDGGVVSVQKTGVTAGTILTYVVGGGGKGGFYGGGRSSGQVIGITSGPMAGGGALVASDGDFSSSVNQSGAEGGAGSGVFLSTATQANAIVIAGGGGGGAGNNNGEGGAGGGQGTASDSSLVGQDGQGGANQGEGGQSTRGGRHGNGTSPRTTAGALLGQTNIYGGSGYTSGGGGGGGYYGGGGGGHTGSAGGMGGAGGGSGYVGAGWTRIESILSLPGGGAHATTGADGGNGKVVIIVDGSTAVSVTSTGTTATYEVV